MFKSNVLINEIYLGLAKRKYAFIIVIFLVLTAKFTTLLAPFFLKIVVDTISIDKTAQLRNLISYLPWIAVGYVFIQFSTYVFEEIKEVISSKIIQPLVADIARKSYDSLLGLPLEHTLNNKYGVVIRDIDRGLKALQSLSALMIHTVIPVSIEIIVVTIFCWVNYEAWIGLIIFIGIFIHLLVTIYGSDRLSIIRKDLNELESEGSGKLGDVLTNLETIKIFSSEKIESKLYFETQSNYAKEAIKFQVLYSKIRLGQQLIIALIMSALLFRSSVMAMAGEITAGDFVLVNVIAMQVLVPISFLGNIWKDISQFLIDINKLSQFYVASVINILEKKILLIEPPKIEFLNVSFRYPSSNLILENINFTAEAGKVTAIVGSSGSGKSTILKLILGLVQRSSGDIKINDMTSSASELECIRGSVGVVPQNVILFKGTIASNIAYGKPNATEKEIETSIKGTALEKKIYSHEDGLFADVGERGLKLSGGERQLLGIARALIKSPNLLLLDEASSSLDAISESIFIENALSTSNQRTCIVVAHRLKSIKDADRIIVIDQGIVAEVGTHKELLNLEGIYFSLWNSQSSNSFTSA